MSATPPEPLSLFRGVLLANLLTAFALFVALSVLAVLLLSKAAERSAFEDIAMELAVLKRRSDNLGVIAPADEIEYRTRNQTTGMRVQSVYLLQRSDGTRVAGNLVRWPEGHAFAAGRLRFDGESAGISSGRIVAEAVIISEQFPLLIGRRLDSIDTLLWRYLPIAALLFLGFGALAAFLTVRTDRQYRQRIAAANAAFGGLRQGDLTRRIPEHIAAGRDEFAQLARSINRALAEIERLVKGLDAFSQTAAHELNRELSQLLDMCRTSDAAQLAQAVEQLIELLRDILRLARIESGAGLFGKRFELVEAVTKAVELYRDAAQMGDVILNVDFARAHDAVINGEGDIVRAAVMNLIENALQHTPRGSTVTVSAEAEGDSVAITVADQGPGAPSEDLGDLIAARSQHSPQGHGFGLRFVQAVAIRHGARVMLRNTSPGLRVTLMFPRMLDRG